MANIQQKNGVFHIRFRHADKQFKRSLKTRDPKSAEAACHSVELTIYRMKTGLLKCPDGVDLGDFVVSGGTLDEPQVSNELKCPTLQALIVEYLASQKSSMAPSYHATQATHLRHLVRGLGADGRPKHVDQVTPRDIEQPTARTARSA